MSQLELEILATDQFLDRARAIPETTTLPSSPTSWISAIVPTEE